tara:strand:- start:26983 stop:27174 length:192 start_codon:yes stop_codon:yes gene_type:complete
MMTDNALRGYLIELTKDFPTCLMKNPTGQFFIDTVPNIMPQMKMYERHTRRKYFNDDESEGIF